MFVICLLNRFCILIYSNSITRYVMYVHRYIVAPSLNHCCNKNSKITLLFRCCCCCCRRSLSTIHKVFSVAMEIQFALLLSCKIFVTLVNNKRHQILRLCVCILTLLILPANRTFPAPYCVVFYGLSDCTVFFYIIS